jgi:hypothetical protein
MTRYEIAAIAAPNEGLPLQNDREKRRSVDYPQRRRREDCPRIVYSRDPSAGALYGKWYGTLSSSTISPSDQTLYLNGSG